MNDIDLCSNDFCNATIHHIAGKNTVKSTNARRTFRGVERRLAMLASDWSMRSHDELAEIVELFSRSEYAFL